MIGAIDPDKRLNNATRPFAVPRIGVGNSSGVHEYNNLYTRFWKKAIAHENPSTAAGVLANGKSNRKTPVQIHASEPVPFLPMCLMSTVKPPRTEAGMLHTA